MLCTWGHINDTAPCDNSMSLCGGNPAQWLAHLPEHLPVRGSVSFTAGPATSRRAETNICESLNAQLQMDEVICFICGDRHVDCSPSANLHKESQVSGPLHVSVPGAHGTVLMTGLWVVSQSNVCLSSLCLNFLCQLPGMPRLPNSFHTQSILHFLHERETVLPQPSVEKTCVPWDCSSEMPELGDTIPPGIFQS